MSWEVLKSHGQGTITNVVTFGIWLAVAMQARHARLWYLFLGFSGSFKEARVYKG